MSRTGGFPEIFHVCGFFRPLKKMSKYNILVAVDLPAQSLTFRGLAGEKTAAFPKKSKSKDPTQ